MRAKNPYHGFMGEHGWNDGYSAGLRDGERRLARALKKWLSVATVRPRSSDIHDWLTARLKRKVKP